MCQTLCEVLNVKAKCQTPCVPRRNIDTSKRFERNLSESLAVSQKMLNFAALTQLFT